MLEDLLKKGKKIAVYSCFSLASTIAYGADLNPEKTNNTFKTLEGIRTTTNDLIASNDSTDYTYTNRDLSGGATSSSEGYGSLVDAGKGYNDDIFYFLDSSGNILEHDIDVNSTFIDHGNFNSILDSGESIGGISGWFDLYGGSLLVGTNKDPGSGDEG